MIETAPETLTREFSYDSVAGCAFDRWAEGAPTLGLLITDRSETPEPELASIVRIDYNPDEGYVALVTYPADIGSVFQRVWLSSGRPTYASFQDVFRIRLHRRRYGKSRPACLEEGCAAPIRYATPFLDLFGCLDHLPDPDADGRVYDLVERHPVLLPDVTS